MTAPTWEARVDAAVKAVYADADLRLEALQLDLLEPRLDGTRARRDGEHEDGTPPFVKVEEARA